MSAGRVCAGSQQDSQVNHMLQARRVKGPRVDRGDEYAAEIKCFRASRSAVGRPRHAQHPVCFAPRTAATRVWELHGWGEQSVSEGMPTNPSLQLSSRMMPREKKWWDGVWVHDMGVRQSEGLGWSVQP